MREPLLPKPPVKRTPSGEEPEAAGPDVWPRAAGWRDRRGQGGPHGQFLKIQVLVVLLDPGVLNSCMHTFPETKDGFTVA